MNKRQERAVNTHMQTVGYLTKHGLRTGPLEDLAIELADCIDRLTQLGAAQEFHTGERDKHVQRVERLRRAVRAKMLQIKRHSTKALKGIAGVEAVRHVPHATAKTSAIVACARGMLKTAQRYKGEYIKRRFPADFLQKLRADVSTLVASVKAVPREAKLLADATAEIRRRIQQAREIERAMDGTMIVLADEGDQRGLSWTNARRMGKVRGRKRKRRGPAEPGTEESPQ
jgi:hypothetical protein